MDFEEPKVNFIHFDSEVVTVTSPGGAGGVESCKGTKAAEECDDYMPLIA